MRRPIDDSLTEDQLRRVDRWTVVSLASIVAVALLAALLLGGSTVARPDWAPSFSYKPGELPTSQSAAAQATSSDELKTNRFDIAYVEPKNPAHRPIYELLKEERILEKIQALLAPVKFPIRITLKMEGCDGVANATFWDDAIKVCYEYVEYIWKQAPKMATRELSQRDAMIGSTVDVFLHEAGHAVLEVLDIPFFGREEEIADYFATYILLQLCMDDARRLILGVSFVSGREMMDEQGKTPELHLMADTHSLPAQRYFNRWCMAYGADPVLFGDAIGFGLLPKSRAKHCRYEYQTNDYAFKKLISPYIDEELKQSVSARKWFELPTMEAQLCPETAPTMISNRSPAVRPETAPGVHPEIESGARPGTRPDYPPAMRPETPSGIPPEIPPKESRDETI